MPDFFDYGFDAPAIQNDDTADLTDVYVSPDSHESGSGDSESTADATVPYDLLDLGTGGKDATPFDFSTDSADLFVFLSAGQGDGSATSDSATPAPKPEPPEFGLEWEMKNLTSARHTATGALLRGILTGQY